MPIKNPASIKVLAIASAGGHWVQLMRLRPAWEGCQVTYVSTAQTRCHQLSQEALSNGKTPPKCFSVTEASRWNKFRLLRQFFQIVAIVIRQKPNVVISTGAAPGFFALQIAKWLGARTIWLDSMANAEELSLSGKKAGSCADLWLTQWPHLAGTDGLDQKKPQFRGSVI